MSISYPCVVLFCLRRCKTVTSMLAFARSDPLTRDKMEKGTRDLIAKHAQVPQCKPSANPGFPLPGRAPTSQYNIQFTYQR